MALALMLALMLATTPGAVLADANSDFLASLSGAYSGRGTASILGDERGRISCKITNDYDDSAKRLTLSGQCASTKGKGPVRGRVSLIGGRLSGTFVTSNENTKVTRSRGRIANGKLILSTTMFNENAGRLVRLRQIIRKTGKGFTLDIHTYDRSSRSYEQSGQITFRKR